MQQLFSNLILFLICITAAQCVDLNETIRMPAAWGPHKGTFMIWPQSEEIWKGKLPQIREEVARIANAIAEFEMVLMLTNASQVSTARSQLDKRIEFIPMPVDDLWAADTMPVFVKATRNGIESFVGVDLHFNGWGKRQTHANDAEVAKRVMEMFNIESRSSEIIAEGGALEGDGKGTLLATKSSLVNDNRNSESLNEIELKLKSLLGVKKIIWFEGAKGGDVTDVHVGNLVVFVRPGAVVVNKPHPRKPHFNIWQHIMEDVIRVLKESTDVDGNRFEIFYLDEPDPEKLDNKGDFIVAYTTFYLVNGGVIVPAFGDVEADAKARETLQTLFPDRKVVSVSIKFLSTAGGGIHCATCAKEF